MSLRSMPDCCQSARSGRKGLNARERSSYSSLSQSSTVLYFYRSDIGARLVAIAIHLRIGYWYWLGLDGIQGISVAWYRSISDQFLQPFSVISSAIDSTDEILSDAIYGT